MINTFLLIVNMAEEAIFIGGENTIPLKKAIAKKLYRNNIDQIQLSQILNISQPMVSNYCSNKQIIPKTSRIIDPC